MASSGPVPRHRAEVVLTFELAALADGGRRLRELSAAAGPPIAVRLSDLLLGDLGNQRVDARLLQAILLREGAVGEWLRSQGIDPDAVEHGFPGTRWH